MIFGLARTPSRVDLMNVFANSLRLTSLPSPLVSHSVSPRLLHTFVGLPPSPTPPPITPPAPKVILCSSPQFSSLSKRRAESITEPSDEAVVCDTRRITSDRGRSESRSDARNRRGTGDEGKTGDVDDKEDGVGSSPSRDRMQQRRVQSSSKSRGNGGPAGREKWRDSIKEYGERSAASDLTEGKS